MPDSTTELSWTGERYVPQIKGSIALEHLHRYAMATEFVKGKRVLDVASGEGYGSQMLARTAAFVTGVDIDERSILHAQKKYQKNNLVFKQGSCTAIPLPDHSIDIVVSFETIEHIKEHEKFLSEIKRVLVPDGSLIISSPEKHAYTEIPKHDNAFHIKELYREEFEILLEKFFKNCSILGQRVLYGCGIFNLAKENSFGGFYKFNDLPNTVNRESVLSYPLYLIALCSDKGLPKIESCFCEQEIFEADCHQELVHKLKEVNHQVFYHQAELAELLFQLKQKDNEIEERDALLCEQKNKIEQQAEEIAAQMAEIDELKSLPLNVHLPEEVDFFQGKTGFVNRWSNKFSSLLIKRLRKEWRERRSYIVINKSNLFNPTWYLKQYPDVAASAIPPLKHYIKFGEKEGRRPHPLFYPIWYLKNNPDVATSGIGPFYHYLEYGWKEGRRPNQFFDAQWYLQQNRDVAAAGIEPLQHYSQWGWKEKRSPNPLFDIIWYLEQYPELLEKGEEPLAHYIEYKSKKEPSTVDHSVEVSGILNYVTKKCGLKIAAEFSKFVEPLFSLVDPNKKEQRKFHVDALKEKIRSQSALMTGGRCDVSIIVPVHNQLPYTLACVASVLSSEVKCSYEILIADDASTDETVAIFGDLHPYVKVVHHPSNLGFLKNCNETAKQAQGEYILFLNNDTLVLPGWLDALIDIFKNHSDAGLVGAKLLNADGTLQEAGGIIWRDASGCNYGRGDDPGKSEYNYVREVDYCSGACIIIPKTIWDELGGFDPLFFPAYCEDSDLAFRVREIGKKVYYQPQCEIIHLEGRSHGKDLKQGIKAYQVANNKKLFQRWKTVLLNHAAPGKKVLQQRDRAFNKKVILVIDHHLPQYDQDAGSKTIWSYIKFFVKRGCAVKFLGDTFITTEPYYTELQQMGVEVLNNGAENPNWATWFKENGKYIDYVFLSRAHIAVKYIDFLKKATAAKLLFYGHDLLSRTFNNNHQILGNTFSINKSKKWKVLEDKTIKGVNVTYYPSYIEVDYLKQCYPERSIKLLPPYVLSSQTDNNFKEHTFSGKLLFVGGFHHPPNTEGVLWFVRKIWPALVENFPGLKFTIAGSHPPKEILQLEDHAIQVTGFISEEKLAELYQTHDIVIVPLLTGGGIKNKVIEALWYRRPVVTTPIGAEGIPNAAEYMKISEPANFLRCLNELLESPDAMQAFSKNASDLIRKYYSEEALYSVLSEDIDFS